MLINELTKKTIEQNYIFPDFPEVEKSVMNLCVAL